MELRQVWIGAICIALLAGCGGDKKNKPPTTNGASITVLEDSAAATVTVSSTDPEGKDLVYAIATNPTKGALSISGPHQFTYTSNLNQNGADQFTYTVRDPKGATATGTVAITITPQPDPPVLNAQTLTGDEDANLSGTIAATDPDGDALTITALSVPANGAFTLTTAGVLGFTPTANFNGTVTFDAQVSDGAATRSALITLVVRAVNDLPEAIADQAVVAPSGVTTLDVLVNDSDVDGDPLTVSVESQPPGATATVVGNELRITPNAGAGGPSRMLYRISDGAGGGAVAGIDLVIDAARPLFYYTGDYNTPERRIRRFDFFTNVELDTPIPAGSRLERYVTSADGRWLVYVTLHTAPILHRLWLRDLVDLAAPVVEITTPANFFASTLALSDDGTLVVFNDRVATTANPTVSQLLDPFVVGGVTISKFTADSRRLYYVQLNNGARTIWRLDISATAQIGSRTQMTVDYGNFEGLGMDFVLTPDESQIVSMGLFMPPPQVSNSIKQYGYVTTADGSRDDTRLHPQYTNVIDGIGPPLNFTRNGRYVVYTATLSGVTGFYSTDLTAPGVAVPIAAPFVSAEVFPAGDANTVFYRQHNGTWYRGSAGTAASGVAFAPVANVPVPLALAASRDGTAVVFSAGHEVYATLGGQYETSTRLGALNGEMVSSLRYSPDSRSLAALGGSSVEVRLFNPKAVGWTTNLAPHPDTPLGCMAFAGEGC
jgi:hypothetical protein